MQHLADNIVRYSMEDIRIGKFQEFKYPSKAEEFNKEEFLKAVSYTKRSVFLNKDIPKIKYIFCCTRCEKEADHEQGHGDAFECGKCGLKRQSFGLGLYIWDDTTEQPKKKTYNDDSDYFKYKLSQEVTHALQSGNYEYIIELDNLFKRVLQNTGN